MKTKAGLVFLSLFAAPHELRGARPHHLARALTTVYPRMRDAQSMAQDAIALAKAQTIDVPGAQTRAKLVKDLAGEALAARSQRDRVDGDLEALLESHPDAALILSLPGMGAVLTADFIACVGSARCFRSADALAAAAGLTPVLRQSGKSRTVRRSTGGDKTLKRVFFQSAFNALADPESRAFYDRKRAEGKRHNQAVIALARRRVNVVWAILKTRTPFSQNFKNAA